MFILLLYIHILFFYIQDSFCTDIEHYGLSVGYSFLNDIYVFTSSFHTVNYIVRTDCLE